MTLFVVATPIGNLEDITLRAIRVLGEVPLIAAEDTRSARTLLSRHGVSTKATSYFEQNKLTKLPELLAHLQTADLALISEAGMPGINDPGYELIKAAAAAGIRVEVIPGPSAVISAVVASALPTDAFVFEGFLPRKSSERRDKLRALSNEPRTIVLYEAPHRLPEALQDIEEVLGDRDIAVCREMTKLHEEIFRGKVSEARSHFPTARGEIVLVIGGKKLGEDLGTNEQATALIISGLKSGTSPSRLAAEIASVTGRTKREIYQLILDMGN